MLDENLLKELNSVPEIAEALELTKESSYTKAELEAYDKYWDSIRTEKTLIADAEAKGEQVGMQKGKIEVVFALNEDKISISQIAKYTKLSEDEVIDIIRNHGKTFE